MGEQDGLTMWVLTEEQFDRLSELIDRFDGRSYRDVLDERRAAVEEVTGAGLDVRLAAIDVDVFTGWCESSGRMVDSAAFDEFCHRLRGDGVWPGTVDQFVSASTAEARCNDDVDGALDASAERFTTVLAALVNDDLRNVDGFAHLVVVTGDTVVETHLTAVAGELRADSSELIEWEAWMTVALREGGGVTLRTRSDVTRLRAWTVVDGDAVQLSEAQLRDAYGTTDPVDPDVRYVGPDARFSSAVASKLGRNQPCPCGSNLKYKRCCGA
jgi:hypothetical protein